MGRSGAAAHPLLRNFFLELFSCVNRLEATSFTRLDKIPGSF